MSLSLLQPTLPEERARQALLELAAALVAESHGLAGLGGPSVAQALRPRLRAMNSYYTNKIEGQHTRPADIERALAKQWDADAREAMKQRLAVAHMAAEEELEAATDELSREQLYSPEFVSGVHAALYKRLPASDCITDDKMPVVPGGWRSADVTAGAHMAPAHQKIAELLDSWSQGYRTLPGTELALVGLACSHHRLLWIHPFIDGNGRAARLHSHSVLYRMGLTKGLWSPMRGLARTHEQYYARLNNADRVRRNDYDGRGPLSQEDLVAFADYFLRTCLDQAQFMRGMLELRGLRERLADLLMYLAAHPWTFGSEKSAVKADALEALHYVAVTGPVERGRFMAMTGLPDRLSRRVLASFIDYGLLTSATSRAPVHFAVPLKSLRFLFPRLWPEAEVDI